MRNNVKTDQKTVKNRLSLDPKKRRNFRNFFFKKGVFFFTNILGSLFQRWQRKRLFDELFKKCHFEY